MTPIRTAPHPAVVPLLSAIALGAILYFLWSGGDTGMMSIRGLPLVLVGAVVAYLKTRARPPAYRWAVRVALAAMFLLFWMIGALGIVGVDGDPMDSLYLGVVAVGMAGALITRFEPRGMALVMVAMAVAQALVGVLSLMAGKHLAAYSSVMEIVGLNAMYMVLYLASAWLFSRSAQPRPLVS